MNIPETPNMFENHLLAVIGGSSLVPLAGLYLFVMFGSISILNQRDLRDSIGVLRVGIPVVIVITALISTFVGLSDDHGRATKDFRAAAKDTYGVSVESDDASRVAINISNGKSSKGFNVDGYAAKVYANVRPNGEVTMRDYRTDAELPHR